MKVGDSWPFPSLPAEEFHAYEAPPPTPREGMPEALERAGSGVAPAQHASRSRASGSGNTSTPGRNAYASLPGYTT